MAKAKSGGGITMSKNVSPPVRTGAPSKGSSPASASQLGQSTAFKKEQVESGRGYDGAKLGNEVALNSKSAPGQGRTLYGQGGVQGLHGPVAGAPRPQSRDILSEYGPDKSKG